ncbi:uncharacterized protein METZ01_LOCUS344664, partial [marine metagenome]
AVRGGRRRAARFQDRGSQEPRGFPPRLRALCRRHPLLFGAGVCHPFSRRGRLYQDDAPPLSQRRSRRPVASGVGGSDDM